MLNLVVKGFMLERFIQIVAEMSPPQNTRSQGIEPLAGAVEHLCAKEKDIQRGQVCG